MPSVLSIQRLIMIMMIIITFVSGKKKKTTSKTEYNYCSIARKYNDMCGKDGKNYIPKK